MNLPLRPIVYAGINFLVFLFAILSAVWGVAAFSGPLLGALIAEFASWRWAFGVFAAGGLAMALVAFMVLSGPRAASRLPSSGDPPPFPWLAMLCLIAAVSLIALAGIDIAPLRSTLFLGGGIAGLVLFFVLDGARPRSRLFPAGVFNPRTPLGRGLIMVAAFSVATISFSIYGPLLLTTLHGISLLTTGYIIAAESIAWSVLSILVANAPPRRERLIIVVGAAMIAGGVAGFAVAIPSGSIPAILVCALLQGGGFGIAWPFVTRIIVQAAPAGETTIASSAVPTLQRIGYAVGAALCGIIANAGGFAEGLNPATAATVAPWLFAAFLPLALVGLFAAVAVAPPRGSG